MILIIQIHEHLAVFAPLLFLSRIRQSMKGPGERALVRLEAYIKMTRIIQSGYQNQLY